MSPWPPRSQSSQQPQNVSPQHHHLVAPRTSSQRQADQPIQYTIPTLHHSRSTKEPKDTTSLHHARSFSHPFPSLFGGGKKGDRHNLGNVNGNAGIDSTDDESSFLRKPGRVKRDNSVSDKEPLTGRCMTCSSTVRWPREVKVFRCVTCLTINDLEPFLEPRKDVYSSRRTEKEQSVQRKTLPISMDRTRAIISRCVTDYLTSLLQNPQTEPSQSVDIIPGHSANAQGHHGRNGTVDRQASMDDYTDEKVIARPHPPRSPRKDRHPERTASLPKQSRTIPRKPVPCSTQKPLPTVPSLQPRVPPANQSLGVPETPAGALSDRGESDLETGAGTSRSAEPRIFKPLEVYIQSSLTGCTALNSSFTTLRPKVPGRAASEGSAQRPVFDFDDPDPSSDVILSHLDEKTLLLGDIAENGSWWTGNGPERKASQRNGQRDRSPETDSGLVSLKTPRINWSELAEWYYSIIHAGDDWKDKWFLMRPEPDMWDAPILTERWESIKIEDIERTIYESRLHAQRQLLKAMENLLKRPRRPLKHAEDCRFLMMLLANPLLFSPDSGRSSATSDQPVKTDGDSFVASPVRQPCPSLPHHVSGAAGTRKSSLGHHAGLIKRILGLIANLSDELHQYIASWFSRFSDSHFQRLVDMVGGFVTYRLTRLQSQKKLGTSNPPVDLIPSFSGPGAGTSAQIHAALTDRLGTALKPVDDGKPSLIAYSDDWQIRTASRVMALLFKANTWHPSKQRDVVPRSLRIQSSALNARHAAHSHGQILPTSNFYNTMLDYCDLVADFEAWESSKTKFSFCRYPFFLSIWAKIHILEHDARRQMEVRAREAFFDSILSRKAVSQYLVLKVRRDCLVEDSLKSVSEVVGSGSEDIKKGLKIDFIGEEGVDAGGLRKEWFLLLTREIFDPQHGLFIYDEESQFCYFNPFCFESSEQFFLVGVLLGLAIYNSAILDVAFPPFAFKKLLASAPSNVPPTTAPKLAHSYTLEDLGEYRPALARGLRQVLEYDGDAEETFALDFVASMDRYGETVQVPLCSGGERKPVTNSNRREFVELYVKYMLDTAVARQYEPFKRGFFTVCGGNALSLFRPEEIELLIRGSEEPLDIASLEAVATYENWRSDRPAEEPQVRWFWETFRDATPKDQRKVLLFITGSDRIPAMGATNLSIKIACLGQDTNRFPSARTCFNMLALYRYESREKLESKLWMAIGDSEGFGLK